MSLRGICGTCYDDYEREGGLSPRNLPCDHSRCLSCLTQLQRDRSLQCPECGKVHQVPLSGVSAFPVDIPMLDYLATLGPNTETSPEIETSQEDEETVLCASHGKNCTKFCVGRQCMEPLCDSCDLHTHLQGTTTTTHHQGATDQQHEIINIRDLKGNLPQLQRIQDEVCEGQALLAVFAGDLHTGTERIDADRDAALRGVDKKVKEVLRRAERLKTQIKQASSQQHDKLARSRTNVLGFIQLAQEIERDVEHRTQGASHKDVARCLTQIGQKFAQYREGVENEQNTMVSYECVRFHDNETPDEELLGMVAMQRNVLQAEGLHSNQDETSVMEIVKSAHRARPVPKQRNKPAKLQEQQGQGQSHNQDIGQGITDQAHKGQDAGHGVKDLNTGQITPVGQRLSLYQNRKKSKEGQEGTNVRIQKGGNPVPQGQSADGDAPWYTPLQGENSESEHTYDYIEVPKTRAPRGGSGGRPAARGGQSPGEKGGRPGARDGQGLEGRGARPAAGDGSSRSVNIPRRDSWNQKTQGPGSESGADDDMATYMEPRASFPRTAREKARMEAHLEMSVGGARARQEKTFFHRDPDSPGAHTLGVAGIRAGVEPPSLPARNPPFPTGGDPNPPGTNRTEADPHYPEHYITRLDLADGAPTERKLPRPPPLDWPKSPGNEDVLDSHVSNEYASLMFGPGSPVTPGEGTSPPVYPARAPSLPRGYPSGGSPVSPATSPGPQWGGSPPASPLSPAPVPSHDPALPTPKKRHSKPMDFIRKLKGHAE